MGFVFESLLSWQKSRILVKNIYSLVNKFPKEERYGLSDQIRRAAISVSSNIAEGSGRISIKEKLHFFEIAFGSLMEVTCQIILAYDLLFISKEELDSLKLDIEELGKIMSGYRSSLIKKLN